MICADLPVEISRRNKTARQKKPICLALFFLCVFLVHCGGCSLLPPKKEEPPRMAAGLQELDRYAWSCYERGLDFMGRSRFELARQQFSLAASSAVSVSLYEDALDGLRRSEQLLEQSR